MYYYANAFSDNIARVIKRPIDERIRAYIRISNHYNYKRTVKIRDWGIEGK